MLLDGRSDGRTAKPGAGGQAGGWVATPAGVEGMAAIGGLTGALVI